MKKKITTKKLNCIIEIIITIYIKKTITIFPGHYKARNLMAYGNKIKHSIKITKHTFPQNGNTQKQYHFYTQSSKVDINLTNT